MLDHISRPGAPQSDYLSRREYVTRSDIAHFVRRNAVIIVGSILISFALAGLYVLLAQPIFTARVELLIDPTPFQTAASALRLRGMSTCSIVLSSRLKSRCCDRKGSRSS